MIELTQTVKREVNMSLVYPILNYALMIHVFKRKIYSQINKSFRYINCSCHEGKALVSRIRIKFVDLNGLFELAIL